MKIGIIGTGAMGCLFGGYLSRRADVTLLTHRKQQAQAIEETGLSIQTDEGPVSCGSLRAVCAAEVSEVFDLLVVFVKAFQTRDAIESIRGCIGPETVILTLQNGIGNGQTLQQLFRPEQILVGTSTINSQRLSDTAVSQHGGMGITTIGGLCGKTALAEQTAAFFTSCGFCAEASTNIDGLIWKKAFINLTINPLTALFDRPIGMVEQCEEAWALGRQEIAEAVSYGVIKMNIDTDTQYAFTRAVAGHMFRDYDGVLKIDGEVGNKKQYDPRSWGREAEDSMAARVVEACEELGSAGRALK